MPTPGPGETLVRVVCAGVCRTDLHVATGRIAVATPRILGHELAGELEDGTSVTVVPWLGCVDCQSADPPRCDHATMLGVDHDGAFAEFVVVPSRAVLALPPMSPRRGAFVEPLAAALAVLRAPLRTAQGGRVLGHGRIAELTRRVLAAAGFHEGNDFVVETEGTAESMQHALESVRLGGTVVLKSRPPTALDLDVTLAVRRELTMVGVHYAPFRTAIGWLAEERIEVDDLFDEPAPLADYARVFERAARAGAKKQFLVPTAR